jgi:phage/plasmid-like protein (TIGR03299 family)
MSPGTGAAPDKQRRIRVAHEVESMMYVGAVPWHGLGVYVGNKNLNSEGAIKAAGLDWNVDMRPLYACMDLNPVKLTIADTHRAVVRDNGEILGVVGSRYHPVQNVNAFNFFDSVVGERLAIYHTAGSLAGGRRIWILAQLPHSILIKGKDKIDKYLLLSNTHDGSGCLRMLFTPVRVVCRNTESMALKGGKGEGINIRHTGSIDDKLKAAKRALGLANEYYKAFEVKANWLADQRFNEIQMQAALEKIFPSKENGEVATRTQNTREKVLELFDKGEGQAPFRGTAWAAYNAFTEFADHYKVVRSGDGDKAQQESRLEAIWFGTALSMKQNALNAIDDILKYGVEAFKAKNEAQDQAT